MSKIGSGWENLGEEMNEMEKKEFPGDFSARLRLWDWNVQDKKVFLCENWNQAGSFSFPPLFAFQSLSFLWWLRSWRVSPWCCGPWQELRVWRRWGWPPPCWSRGCCFSVAALGGGAGKLQPCFSSESRQAGLVPPWSWRETKVMRNIHPSHSWGFFHFEKRRKAVWLKHTSSKHYIYITLCYVCYIMFVTLQLHNVTFT